MRLAIALQMIVLLVHLQVAGVVCACEHEEGHSHAASPLAPHTHTHSHRHGAGHGATSSPALDGQGLLHEIPHDPHQCECAPAQPYEAPTTQVVLPSARTSVEILTGGLSPLVGLVAAEGRQRAGLDHGARPPPLSGGVCSACPWALPVLQI